MWIIANFKSFFWIEYFKYKEWFLFQIELIQNVEQGFAILKFAFLQFPNRNKKALDKLKEKSLFFLIKEFIDFKKP